MKHNSRNCPECGGALYTTNIGSAGGQGPALLPGLGGFLRMARFDTVVCADCGLTRFYAEPRAREKLPRAQRWKPS